MILLQGIRPLPRTEDAIPTSIPFTSNCSDLSNTDGYRSEFHCDRCGNGYRSVYRRDVAATGQKVARGLGSLFDGRFYDVTSAVDRVLDRSTNSEAKDKTLSCAVVEIAPDFHQCRGCGDRVCGAVCRNELVGQCVRRSPVASGELAQLEAVEPREQVGNKPQDVDLTAGMTQGEQSHPRCGSCGAQSQGGKFCSACGSPLSVEVTCSPVPTRIQQGHSSARSAGRGRPEGQRTSTRWLHHRPSAARAANQAMMMR